MKTRKKKVVYSNNQVDLPYMEFIQNNLFNMSHPVESIFETTNSSCDTPEHLVNYFKTLFGVSSAGTWESFGAGRVLVGYGIYVENSASTFYDAESTGGSKDAVVVTHSHETTIFNKTASFKINKTDNDDGGPHKIAAAGLNTTEANTTQVNSHHPESDVEGSGATQISIDLSHSHFVPSPAGAVSGAGKNMQPYIVVYRYRRIS